MFALKTYHYVKTIYRDIGYSAVMVVSVQNVHPELQPSTQAFRRFGNSSGATKFSLIILGFQVNISEYTKSLDSHATETA